MLNKEVENSFNRIAQICLFNRIFVEGNMNQIKRYIEQLESELEMYKDVKDLMNSKVKNIKILTNKDIDKKVNERNRKLIEKLEEDIEITKKQYSENTLLNIRVDGKLDTLEEILKILKGENDESNR